MHFFLLSWKPLSIEKIWLGRNVQNVNYYPFTSYLSENFLYWILKWRILPFLTRFAKGKIQLSICWSTAGGERRAMISGWQAAGDDRWAGGCQLFPCNNFLTVQPILELCCYWWQNWGQVRYWRFSLVPFRSYCLWYIGKWHFLSFPCNNVHEWTIQSLLFKYLYVVSDYKMEVSSILTIFTFIVQDFYGPW